jgi:hypothetical protein
MLYVTAEVAEIAAAEIAWLREERRSISTLLQKVESLEAENKRLREERRWVTLPMPFEPWRYGPLSYRKCEVLAALRKAGVKWQPLPPGPEGGA